MPEAGGAGSSTAGCGEMSAGAVAVVAWQPHVADELLAPAAAAAAAIVPGRGAGRGVNALLCPGLPRTKTTVPRRLCKDEVEIVDTCCD